MDGDPINFIDYLMISNVNNLNKNGPGHPIVACTGHCIVCQKTKKVLQIGVDVYIEPNRMVVAGIQHRISNPMFRVLCAFHENPGVVLSRAFLLSYGWGVSYVIKNNVAVAISELRALLTAKSDLRIITIHGRGYQMLSMDQGRLK
jgi:DNA-binding response OmpR family regulator